jgi:hypothetical protein
MLAVCRSNVAQYIFSKWISRGMALKYQLKQWQVYGIHIYCCCAKDCAQIKSASYMENYDEVNVMDNGFPVHCSNCFT